MPETVIAGGEPPLPLMCGPSNLAGWELLLLAEVTRDANAVYWSFCGLHIRNGRPPTLDEVGVHNDMGESRVAAAVDELLAAGLIVRDPSGGGRRLQRYRAARPRVETWPLREEGTGIATTGAVMFTPDEWLQWLATECHSAGYTLSRRRTKPAAITEEDYCPLGESIQHLGHKVTLTVLPGQQLCFDIHKFISGEGGWQHAPDAQ